MTLPYQSSINPLSFDCPSMCNGMLLLDYTVLPENARVLIFKVRPMGQAKNNEASIKTYVTAIYCRVPPP